MAPTSPHRRIAVIGAGIAGLACAGLLARAGRDVVVYDKGRRPGGRVATRRIGPLTFNHGAQFATARGPAFAAVMDRLRDAGAAAFWPDAGAQAQIGLPGMSALPAALEAAAQGAHFHYSRHVCHVHEGAVGWSVRHLPATDARPGEVRAEGGAIDGPFDAVLLALPAPQAAPLLAALPHAFALAAERAVMAPCWAAMASYADRVPGPNVLRPETGPIAWAARESSRPGAEAGMEGTTDAWMLHARPEWSRAHLEAAAPEAGRVLVEAFAALTGAPPPDSVTAHRWRHALVEAPLGQPCLWDDAAGLGACGDWCLDRRVEAAFDSGEALARAVLQPATAFASS